MFKKFANSVVRTIFAIALIAIALFLLRVGFDWKAFGIPNNSAGTFITFASIVFGFGAIIYGIYFVAPKLWKVITYLVLFKNIPGEKERLAKWFARHNRVYLW